MKTKKFAFKAPKFEAKSKHEEEPEMDIDGD